MCSSESGSLKTCPWACPTCLPVSVSPSHSKTTACSEHKVISLYIERPWKSSIYLMVAVGFPVGAPHVLHVPCGCHEDRSSDIPLGSQSAENTLLLEGIDIPGSSELN